MPDPRGILLRTKTGCLSCRIRRVKCDETKPHCNRCTRTGRHCDGYASVPISRRELIARQFPDPNWSALDRKCFDFFRLRTAKADWDIILQLSYLEPSIRHGVLALGSLHHDFNRDESTALKAYDKAIQHTRILRDTTKILAACVIFVCYEYLNGNYSMGNMHLRNGLNIAGTSPTEDELILMLRRLDFQSMTFPDARIPYPYPEPKVLHTRIPTSFSTARDARTAMVEIQICSMNVVQAYTTGKVSQKAIDARESCRAKLREWKTAFDRSKNENWVPMPRMYYLLATLMIEAGCEDRETAWDEYLPMLEMLLNACAPLAKIKSFSLEMGTTLPMFTIATKCRDPRIRRKAIEILKTPRREGIWNSVTASKVAERVMMIEEGSRIVEKAEDVPEEARIHSVLMENLPGQKTHLRTTFLTKHEDEWLYMEEDIEIQ